MIGRTASQPPAISRQTLREFREISSSLLVFRLVPPVKEGQPTATASGDTHHASAWTNGCNDIWQNHRATSDGAPVCGSSPAAPSVISCRVSCLGIIGITRKNNPKSIPGQAPGLPKSTQNRSRALLGRPVAAKSGQGASREHLGASPARYGGTPRVSKDAPGRQKERPGVPGSAPRRPESTPSRVRE